MIRRFRFKNFYSFAEEQEISFQVGKKPARSWFDITLDEASGERLNKVTAIVGANGSGKTHALRPLAFLSWFVCDSIMHKPEDKIAYMPHLLKAEETTQLELDFILDGEDYRYKLELTPEAVLHESLHKKTSRLYSYIFTRDKAESGYLVKQKGFGFPRAQAEIIRGNTSLIGSGNLRDLAQARRFYAFFDAISSNISNYGRTHYADHQLFEAAEFLQKTPALAQQVSRHICDLDLGISKVEIDQVKGDNPNERTAYVPHGIHETQDGGFELPFVMESSGTKSAYVLLRRIVPVLEHGGVAVVDELDNDLHPHMISYILDLFRFEHSNPHNSQLIFTCHSPEVLNALQKHQVYLTEKIDLCSESWRMDEVVGLRADDNLYAKYMSGALGAVPEL